MLYRQTYEQTYLNIPYAEWMAIISGPQSRLNWHRRSQTNHMWLDKMRLRLTNIWTYYEKSNDVLSHFWLIGHLDLYQEITTLCPIILWSWNQTKFWTPALYTSLHRLLDDPTLVLNIQDWQSFLEEWCLFEWNDPLYHFLAQPQSHNQL